MDTSDKDQCARMAVISDGSMTSENDEILSRRP
jgi:hypothetical protein